MTDMIAEARAFAATHVAPFASEWEAGHVFPRETIRAAGAAGLCGLLVPTAQGGAGLDVTGFCRVMEALSETDMAFGFALVPHNNFARSMASEGSQAHREAYLDAMTRGQTLGAFLLTEPQAGTNASQITTTARRVGDGWVIDGEKAWITGGIGADLLRVYAQTEPGSGGRGIGAFLVHADQPGVERTAAYDMLGCHASGAAGVRLRGVEVGAQALFSAPGTAFADAMHAIGLARVVVAAMCLGILRNSLQVAVAYLKERQAFGAALSEQQGLRWMLADVATDLEAASGLTYTAAGAVDRDEADAVTRAAHAKKFAARAATDGVAACMQVLGANGFRQDRPIARHYAAAKMAHYIDGTTEVQNLLIANDLFGRG